MTTAPPKPTLKIAALQQRIAHLEREHQATIGVGSGGGQLFVHGDYPSIKAAQKLLDERADALKRITELERQATTLLSDRQHALRQVAELQQQAGYWQMQALDHGYRP